MKNTITFIGGGNMTYAILEGLVADGYPRDKLYVTNRSSEKLIYYRDQLKINTTQDNREGAKFGNIIVLSVKPLQLQEVCNEIKDIVNEKKPLVISVAAGAPIALIQKWFGSPITIIRAMPNTPSMVLAGVTGLYANSEVNNAQKDMAEEIFRAIGLTLWLASEDQLNMVNAVSGCGPAYIYLVMEVIQKAAQHLGLSADMAKLITLQTTLGAARMAMESDRDLEQLRRAVTSPKGTTEHGIAVLEKGNIRQLFLEAIEAAYRRAKELADTLE